MDYEPPLVLLRPDWGEIRFVSKADRLEWFKLRSDLFDPDRDGFKCLSQGSAGGERRQTAELYEAERERAIPAYISLCSCLI